MDRGINGRDPLAGRPPFMPRKPLKWFEFERNLCAQRQIMALRNGQANFAPNGELVNQNLKEGSGLIFAKQKHFLV